jgi:hypothetical protein
MGAPDDSGVDSPTTGREQDAAARPRLERARSSSLGALIALGEPQQATEPAVPLQDDVEQISFVGDARDGGAQSSVGLGLSGIGAEQRDAVDDGVFISEASDALPGA